MDDTFFQDLDAHITNVGTDKCWKKRVGDMVLWFSPIPYDGQLQANEALSKLSRLEGDETGIDAVQETKRITLSHAIVGFDKFDLRRFRFAGPCVPVLKRINGKDEEVQVELHKYVYGKIAGWDSEFVDVAFSVFADLSETNKNEIMKDVKFENVKDPREELSELEMRASELRDQLNLPPMVEAEPIGDEKPSEDKARVEPEDDVGEEDFNPFKPVDQPPRRAGRIQDQPPVRQSRPVQPQPPAEDLPAEELPDPLPDPVRTVPVPIPQQPEVSPIQRELEARRSRGRGPVHETKDPVSVSSPESPHPAIPSVPNEVLERPAERKVVEPPRIDPRPSSQSRNSRFSPPQGR